MKKLFIFPLLLVLLLSACSEKDNPTDTKIYGYQLEQFVSTALTSVLIDPEADSGTDFRDLFAYEIVSADAEPWSPRQSSNAGYDLAWGSFRNGFLVPSDGNRTWFTDLSLPGAFKVRNTGSFRLYRKIDLLSGARDSTLVELRGLQPHCVENWSAGMEDAIKLSDLLAGYSGYTAVTLIAADGYTYAYTPEQIADGYYLLNSEVTTFPAFNSSMPGGQKKFKKLAKVRVSIEATPTGHIYPLADSVTRDLEIPIPTDFSAYQATHLPDY